jgi:hypothetical protein
MKVKAFVIGIGEGEIEDKVNTFIAGKKVIDIKILRTRLTNQASHPTVLILVMYEESSA